LEARAHFLTETEVASLHRRHCNNMTNDTRRLQKYWVVALHKSIARRRASGCNEPLDPFFMQRFTMDTIFSSTGSESIPVSAADV
jgi:hypothetical protein